MTQEYARIESAVNWVVGKSLTLLVCGLLVWGLWIGRHASRLAARLWDRLSGMIGSVLRT
jgi:hypothetical protein